MTSAVLDYQTNIYWTNLPWQLRFGVAGELGNMPECYIELNTGTLSSDGDETGEVIEDPMVVNIWTKNSMTTEIILKPGTIDKW